MSASPVLSAIGNRVKGPLGVENVYIAPSTSNAGGYHNSRNRLLAIGSVNDYSVVLASDKAGSGVHWCALDLTGAAATRLITTRLKAAMDRRDPRIRYFREILGSHDNKTTVRYTHDWEDQAWRTGTRPDPSHLTHVHMSLFRRYEGVTSIVDEVVGLLLGSPTGSEGDEMSEFVKQLQRTLNATVVPANQQLTVDGVLGGATLGWWSRHISGTVWDQPTTNPARLDENKQPRAQKMGDFVRWSEAMHFSARDMVINAVNDKTLSQQDAARIASQVNDELATNIADRVADRLIASLPGGGMTPAEVRAAAKLGVVDALRLGTDSISG